MNEADLGAALRDTVLVMLKLGGPPLLVALAVGVLVALVQAVTQINEAAMAFVPKLLAMCVCLSLLGPFIHATLKGFTLGLFARMAALGAP